MQLLSSYNELKIAFNNRLQLTMRQCNFAQSITCMNAGLWCMMHLGSNHKCRHVLLSESDISKLEENPAFYYGR